MVSTLKLKLTSLYQIEYKKVFVKVWISEEQNHIVKCQDNDDVWIFISFSFVFFTFPFY